MVTPGCLKGWGNEWRVCSLVLPTPSLLSLVHNSLHSQLLATVFPFLPGIFFLLLLSTQEDILIALLNISHILQPTYFPPTDTHTCINVRRYDGKSETRRNTSEIWPYRHRDSSSLNNPLFDTHSKSTYFEITRLLTSFSCVLFATIEIDWKDQQGGFYYLNQPSLPLQSQHSVGQS